MIAGGQRGRTGASTVVEGGRLGGERRDVPGLAGVRRVRHAHIHRAHGAHLHRLAASHSSSGMPHYHILRQCHVISNLSRRDAEAFSTAGCVLLMGFPSTFTHPAGSTALFLQNNSAQGPYMPSGCVPGGTVVHAKSAGGRYSQWAAHLVWSFATAVQPGRRLAGRQSHAGGGQQPARGRTARWLSSARPQWNHSETLS